MALIFVCRIFSLKVCVSVCVRVLVSHRTEKYLNLCVGKAIPVQAYYKRRGFLDIEAPRFRDSRHMKALSLSAQLTGRHYLQEIFLVLISLGA